MSDLLKRFRLERAWLLENEARLCALLHPFLSFRGHSLYFTAIPLAQAELLAEERRLLIPVLWENKFAAALRLDAVLPEEARKLLSILPPLVSLCLRELALAKASALDNSTCLASENALIDALSARIACQPDNPQGKIDCIGLIVIEWPDAEKTGKRAGYKLVEEHWREMAEELAANLPADAMAANSGINEWLREFTILLPAYGRSTCHALARKLIARISRPPIIDPFSKGSIPVLLQAGHIIFPHDLQGADLRRPARQQALALRDRARLAAKAASHASGKAPVMAFAWLLQRGGVILECLPHNRLRISLGRASYALPGMRFQIFTPGGGHGPGKGEIIIRKTGLKDSIAEIYHQEMAASRPMPGDSLALIRPGKTGNGSGFPALLELADFFEKYRELCKKNSLFSLSISAFLPAPPQSTPVERLTKFQASLENAIKAANIPEPITCGRYSHDGIIIFWPAIGGEQAARILANVHAPAKEAGYDLASGIFSYPFLNFSKQDGEACCQKALEYAMLLPAPHIGCLDYLALTISGDKRLSQGDELGAIEDYRLALLLKPDHAIALNSLGVCMAAMNRHAEALELLGKALQTADKELQAQIYYNFGNIFQKDNNLPQALANYKKCVKSSPNHAFAWLRMGQIHARNNRTALARAIYRHAEKLAGDQTEIVNIARRQLARLEAAANRAESAREILHDTLLLNPSDTDSLLLLAKTYLGDDPATAETLARKCLRLGVDAYDILAGALKAQGREAEINPPIKKN